MLFLYFFIGIRDTRHGSLIISVKTDLDLGLF